MEKLSDLHTLILEKGAVSCGDIEEVMFDYSEEELIPTIKNRVDEHISECQECTEFKESYLYTIKLASSLNVDEPVSVDIQNRLRAKLNERLGLSIPMVAA